MPTKEAYAVGQDVAYTTQHADRSPYHTAAPHPPPEANILYRSSGGHPVTKRPPACHNVCRGMMPCVLLGGSRVKMAIIDVSANMHSKHVCVCVCRPSPWTCMLRSSGF